MKSLNAKTLFQVNGGFGPLFGAAAAPTVTRGIVAGMGAFNVGAGAIIATVTQVQQLNNLGAKLGEATFNARHPNQLGQMVFNR